MNIDNKNLAIILVKGNYINEDIVNQSEEAIVRDKKTLFSYLLDQNILTKDLIGQAIAEYLNVSYSDLNSNQPTKDQILKIPEEIAKKYRYVLFEESKDKQQVIITTDDPKKEIAPELSKIFPNQKVIITYSLTEDIDNAFFSYQKSLDTRFSKIIESKQHIAPEILQQIFEDAYVFRASDIHFEPRPKDVIIRFRIDGVLHNAGILPKEHYENILNRIKVQSRLRIDEHFAAQDGSMRFENGDNFFDLRTSIVPTVEGEKIVLRMLASYVQGFGLSNLGMSEQHQAMLEDVARKPFGMILVTGPTGSGKTTTLYALLKLLHKPEVNITTIEDPVEYKIAGINQIQVNPQTNLTFAKGLRSIVRQDPDIILVGEIRDEETAEIAVNAALTGHLLLSTFHANDAATAIPRLLDMKVEPFLIASTVELIIAQRLVRRICSSCRYSTLSNSEDIALKFPGAKEFFKDNETTLYAGKGCNVCSNTGYQGRAAIFEFIRVTPELQDIILKNPSTKEIWEIAKKQGSQPIFEDGINKVKNGITTLEELLRVSPPVNLD